MYCFGYYTNWSTVAVSFQVQVKFIWIAVIMTHVDRSPGFTRIAYHSSPSAFCQPEMVSMVTVPCEFSQVWTHLDVQVVILCDCSQLS